MSEDGEARNHEAEIEAVARALRDDFLDRHRDGAQTFQRQAEVAITALDAVRRSPQGGDHGGRCGEAMA